MSTVQHQGAAPASRAQVLTARLRQGPLDVDACIHLGLGLLGELDALHRRGRQHLGVTPQTVLLLAGPTSRCRLSPPSTEPAPTEGPALLTRSRYLAPEQTGLVDLEVGEAADLYAVGAVLYEALVGRPLLGGTTVNELLRQQLNRPTPQLRGLGLAVPRVLEEIVERLLRRDPRDRYGSAAGAVADLERLAVARRRGDQDPNLVIGLVDRRRTLTEPAFVGRARPLAQLEDQRLRSEDGRGRLVLLEADSGGGKTRVLDEFSARCAERGCHVFRGQGVVQSAQRPFELFSGIAAGLVAAQPALCEAVVRAQGDWLDAACRALPALAALSSRPTAAAQGPDDFGEARSVRALAALIDALGAGDRPAVVLLDDCQWADESALKVLRHRQHALLSAPAAGSVTRPGVLVVLAFRSEEVPVGHPLRRLEGAVSVLLPAFAPHEIRAVAESMAGALPDAAIEVVTRLAAGSPFMAPATLRGLVEGGALVPGEGGWRVEDGALGDAQASRHAGAFLARRLGLLPADTLAVLSAGAVLGKEFDAELATGLAGQPPERARERLAIALRRHIVWEDPASGRHGFVHDKLREGLLARLSDDERRRLHRRAAEALGRQDPPPIFQLGFHLDAAGQPELALPYASAAAQQARTQYSLALAEEQLRIVARGTASSDRRGRARVAEDLGEVLMLTGRYPDALAAFTEATQLAEDPHERARIDGKLGDLLFKTGDNQAAAEAIERAMRSLGLWVPKSTAGFLLCLCWEVTVQALHTLLPRLFLARRSTEGAERALLIIRQYNLLTYPYFFHHGKLPCLAAHLRAINLAERYPPTPELAHAWATHAPVMALLPWVSRGEDFAQRSLRVRTELGDLWGQGQSLNYWGVLRSVDSRFDESIEKCSAAVRLLRQSGDFWEQHIARWFVANARYRKGELGQALDEVRRLYADASEMGDDKVSGICIDIWARASCGHVPPEILARELTRDRRDVQASVQVLLGAGVQQVFTGDLDAAVQSFERAQATCRAVSMKNDWVAPVWTWIVTALRLRLARRPPGAPHREGLRRLRQASRASLAMARSFKSDLPHALREAALVAALSGRHRRARRLLDRSLAVAEEQGARLEHALSRLERGRLGRVFGWAGAEQDEREARAEILERKAGSMLGEAARAATERPEGASLSVADRFDTVLGAGRAIASALTRESVIAAVLEAAAGMLWAQECFVVERDAEGRWPEPAVGFTVAMVEQAVARQGPLTWSDGGNSGEELTEAAILAGIRSALAAPILVRGRADACLCVLHRELRDLFGDREQRLSAFLATVAGAALENAEGFAQLQQLTRTLEEKVADRTAALETSNIELQQFAYVASHDLQTPLRAIMSFAQFLQSDYGGQLDPQADQYLERIMAGADRMQRLIRDLLAWSRVESAARRSEPVSLEAVLAEVLDTHELALAGSGGVVTHDPLPVVQGDPGQLFQLLLNLVSNGLKYHGELPPRVHLSAFPGPDGWEVTVRDEGIGIAPEHHDRVFEIFRRLHTEAEFPGTGIGLAVCRRIVQRHGGWIQVVPDVQQGCEFRFCLPYDERSPDELAPETGDVAPAPGEVT